MSTYVPIRVGQAIARLLANGELHLVVVVVLWYVTGVGGWVGVSASKKEQGVELGVIEVERRTDDVEINAGEVCAAPRRHHSTAFLLRHHRKGRPHVQVFVCRAGCAVGGLGGGVGDVGT